LSQKEWAIGLNINNSNVNRVEYKKNNILVIFSLYILVFALFLVLIFVEISKIDITEIIVITAISSTNVKPLDFILSPTLNNSI